MATLTSKRSVMTLFSDPMCSDCHRVRIVLAEKGINADIIDVKPDQLPAELLELNPYGNLPTLIDRETVLYDPNTIMEYLDERFPHPPLMPVDPVSRARTRLGLYRFAKDWYGPLGELHARRERGRSDKKSVAARKALQEALLSSDVAFSMKEFFLSDELSLVDCTIVPVLWRLKKYNITLPDDAKHLKAYAKNMFERPQFRNSLSDWEAELGE